MLVALYLFLLLAAYRPAARCLPPRLSLPTAPPLAAYLPAAASGSRGERQLQIGRGARL